VKPVELQGPCMVKVPPMEKALIKAHKEHEGEIDSLVISPDLWDPTEFAGYLAHHGYRRRESERYSSLTLTWVNGSAKWHTDPGFGLVVCWLLFDSDPGFDGAQLVTRHGPLNMRMGDICVFDANQGHAWISNGVSVMLMVTVSRIRQRVVGR
jgi:hypothetical protein